MYFNTPVKIESDTPDWFRHVVHSIHKAIALGWYPVTTRNQADEASLLLQAMESTRMKNQTVACVLAYYILTSLQGCATRGSNGEARLVAAEAIPEADPALDHYVAWVPRDAAQTPAVAMALTHISMGYAKEQAARSCCGEDWLVDESVTEQTGPIATIAPEAIGRYPAWFYRISLQPGLHGCEQTSAPQLYQSIQDNLPEWITLETAVKPAPGTVTLRK